MDFSRTFSVFFLFFFIATVLLVSVPVSEAFIVNVTSAGVRVDVPDSPANTGVVGRESVRPFFTAARLERVDIVGIGDSNQGFRLAGWDEGYQFALSQYYPLYATGLISLNDAGGNNSFMGYLYNRVETMRAIGHFDGAPLLLDRVMNKGAGNYSLKPHNYAYLSDDESYAPGVSHGFKIHSDCPLNVSSRLRFHLTYGTFSNGSGSFRPLVVDDQTRAILVREETPLNPVTGIEGDFVDYTLDLPSSSSRTHSLNFRLLSDSGDAIQGPFFGTYYRAENLDISKGISFSTLLFAGGYSARKMADALRSADPAYLDDFFSRVRALQGPTKHVLVRINAGMNDRQETLPGIKTGVGPGWSPPAFKENVQDIVDSISAVWARNAWDARELYFLIVVSHDVPSDFRDASNLDAFRPVADQIARDNPRTASVNLKVLAPSSEMVARSWYNQIGNSTDYPHLSYSGYLSLSEREIRALLAGGP